MKSLTTETRQATKTTEKTIVDKHSLGYTEVSIVLAMRKGVPFMFTSLAQSYLFSITFFPTEYTKLRFWAVGSCFYHEVSEM